MSKDYSEKQAAKHHVENELMKLAWDTQELSSINETGRQLRVESTVLQEKLQDNDYDIVVDNFPRQLEEFNMKLKGFFRRSIKYRRQVATHALVVMISPEQRAKKPYALPVQCLSCNTRMKKYVQLLMML